MGIFKSAPVSLDPDIEQALIAPADWRAEMARKEIAKETPKIRTQAAACGGQLSYIAYSFYDGTLVVTTEAVCGGRMMSIISLADILDVDITSGERNCAIIITSRTHARFAYRVDSLSEAHSVQKALGFT